MSLSVTLSDKLWDCYREPILNCHNYTGLKPVLLVSIAIRVLNCHLDSHDGLTCIHCFGVDAGAIEGGVELGIVVIPGVVSNLLGLGISLEVGSLLMIKALPLVMINTITAVFIY